MVFHSSGTLFIRVIWPEVAVQPTDELEHALSDEWKTRRSLLKRAKDPSDEEA